MQITAKTKVSEILNSYGDIAEVMEVFGVKKVGNLGIRKFIARFITVRTAAFVHRIPLQGFINMLERAISEKAKN